MNIKILSSLTNAAEKRNNILTIGTHNGIFHSDEVVACAILCLIHSNISVQILRSREVEFLNQCDICVDIGGGEFDHHQAVYSLVDCEDNGISTVGHCFSFISSFLPLWFNSNTVLETLQSKKQVLSMSDTHKSNDLASICYAILEELSKIPNYPIKKCQHCGMYFIPKAKTDEVYCDYPKENSKPCRELGAFQSYTQRLKDNQTMGEYRRTYQRLFMQVRKDKSNTKLAKDFENWKKQAKEKINDMKKGKLTENQVYQWILKNK